MSDTTFKADVLDYLDEHGDPAPGETHAGAARQLLDEGAVDPAGRSDDPETAAARYVGEWRRSSEEERRDGGDGQRATDEPPESPLDEPPEEPKGLRVDTQDAYPAEDGDYWIVYMPKYGTTVEVDGEIVRKMKRAYSNEVDGGATINEIAQQYGWSREAFKQFKRALGWTHDDTRYTDREHLKADDQSKLVQSTVQARKGEYIRKRNKEIWRRIKADAERWREWEQTVARPLLDQLQSVNPPEVETPETASELAAVLFPTDLHIDQENVDGTGIGYNRRAALQCHAGLLDKVRRIGTPERIYLAIGSDLWNVDRDDGRTAAGTLQQNDRRPASTVGFVAQVGRELIEATRGVCADLRVMTVPGNHDRRTCQIYHWALQEIYHDCEDVSVVGEPIQRQYHRYGDNLLIFAHGDRLSGGQTGRSKTLAATAANEVPEMWGQTTHRYAHLGHRHSYEGHDDGVWVEQAPTSTPNDEWHHRDGYVRSSRGQMGWVYEREGGLAYRPTELIE